MNQRPRLRRYLVLLWGLCIRFYRVILQLFSLIVRTSQFPLLWRVSCVLPVFWSGDNIFINTYRPIPIIFNFDKVFKIVLLTYIYNSFKSLLSPVQHGIVEARSIVTNLTLFTQFISEVFDGVGQSDAVYTDFQKAPDKIDHYTMLSNLHKTGVSDHFYVATLKQISNSSLGGSYFVLFYFCVQPRTVIVFKLYKWYYWRDRCQVERMTKWCMSNSLSLSVYKCNIVT